MKIGVLSDTHSHADRVRLAVGRLVAKGVKVLFHCGDLTSPEVVNACESVPTYFVLGNNDHDRLGIENAIRQTGARFLGQGGVVELGGKKIAITHGHLNPVRASLLAECPDFLLVGHSHQWGDSKIGAVRVINPGALHQARRWTVAIIDLKKESVDWLELEKPNLAMT